MSRHPNATKAFEAARTFLMEHREDYETAYSKFRWPRLEQFNWALDWFDVYAEGNTRPALHVISEHKEQIFTFAELADSSARIAQGLLKAGIQRGDPVLLMLTNVPALWDIMLACQKIGAIIIPTATQATTLDLTDRIARGRVKAVVTDPTQVAKFEGLENFRSLIAILDSTEDQSGWITTSQLRNSSSGPIPGSTQAQDPLLLYFTSGTTAKPKLVLHTHQSYPVGHLSTMYWIGIREGSVHQNISSPGWAKHAWSSFFAPWNAGACILVHDAPRFQAASTLEILRTRAVNSLCAPPTVWRMLILHDLGSRPEALQELVSAGEPLNPEIIDHVKKSWNLTIRDGYGQTETTAQIANSPGTQVIPGAMGRPLPGYRIVLLDAAGRESNEGEVAIKLGDDRPLGLMQGYSDDPEKTAAVMADACYRTGDEAMRCEGNPELPPSSPSHLMEYGYFQFVGRGDDVFKSSDYRISPFELESVLLECDLVAESAVVPSPDALRLSVPKAFVTLKPGIAAGVEAAAAIFQFQKDRLASYKQIRRLEFAELPKTISGKIRRVELRNSEAAKIMQATRGHHEYWLEDFR